jgi:phosphoserine phosphatase RsbX
MGELLPRVAMQVRALAPESACGDATGHWALPQADGSTEHLLSIIDGLGHGPEAHQAAQQAQAFIEGHTAWALPELLLGLDHALKKGRGAALGLVRLTHHHLEHAGVGNTRALCWRGEQRFHLPSQAGIVGSGLHQPIHVTRMAVQPDDWLLLFTDGIHERAQLPLRLPEWQRDPQTLCQHLLTQWRDLRDDAGVLVLQMPPLPQTVHAPAP